MTLGMKMRMQDARDRAWTMEEIAEAFGVGFEVVRDNTIAEERSLRRGQRAVLRWCFEEAGGMMTGRTLGRHMEVLPQNAMKRLRRLQRMGYIERVPLCELRPDQLSDLDNPDSEPGNPQVVWALTVRGLRAARDRLEVVA